MAEVLAPTAIVLACARLDALLEHLANIDEVCLYRVVAYFFVLTSSTGHRGLR